MKGMNFTVGTWVHDPLNGVGRVIAIHDLTLQGDTHSFIHISFNAPKFIARIPLLSVEKRGLRTLASKEELDLALKVLAGKSRITRGLWSHKAKAHEEKLSSGVPALIAQVIRDLYFPNPDQEQSYTEFNLFQKAFQRLSEEYRLVFKCTSQEVKVRFYEMLKQKQNTMKVA